MALRNKKDFARGIERMSRRLMKALLLVASLHCSFRHAVPLPTHPALRAANLPELIPVRRIVAGSDYKSSFLISPDGRHLLWAQAVGSDLDWP